MSAELDKKDRKNIRIGIDVGGTFTHAVAIDAADLSLVGKAKVPTSHSAPEGVARGIVDVLHNLLEETEIKAEEVSFIAHSTTQATNALLEGDVAKVGVIGMSSAGLAPLARQATNLGRVPLASGIYLETAHRFIVYDKNDKDLTILQKKVETLINELKSEGCTAIAISDAFAVDGGEKEEAALSVASRLGILATAGSEVSRLYGLRVRTRTAAINAGILPKIRESADLTESSVRKSGISAPIMIMRSDGGVMDIDSMRKRPILSILSGPAAGVAAAMMFLKISDGVFLEVGGTSTDISAIANGRALVRSAEIGGHKVYMRTLDVRTIGVAGGSVPRVQKEGGGGVSKIIDIGPRSAHIAGLKYASFPPQEFLECDSALYPVVLFKPLPKDPADYLSFTAANAGAAAQAQDSADRQNISIAPNISVTPTCASNLLGLVPAGDCAVGNMPVIENAFASLAAFIGTDANDKKSLAERMLSLAAAKCIPTVKALIAEHKLDPELTVLVGGGGGAAAIVPFVAKTMGLTCRLAEHADVISAIGVAMALIRETVERQVPNAAASGEVILSLRAEVFESVRKMGADPATIEVHVEIDSKTSVVRATACGAAKVQSDKAAAQVDESTLLETAAQSMRVEPAAVERVCSSEHFTIFGAKSHRQGSFLSLKLPFLGSDDFALRVLDQDGVVRLSARNGASRLTSKESAEELISALIEEHSTWGDAGKTIPDIMLLMMSKIIDLSGLLNEGQVLTLARSELATLPAGTAVIVLAKF